MKKILSIVLILAGFVMAQGFGDLINQSDAKHDADDFSATFELLKQAEQLEANNFEVIWRLARAHFDFSDNSEDEIVISDNFYMGLDYAKKALELDDGRAEGHKWYGILIGKVGELEGTKQKILNSYEVKDHTLKAIELDPEDDGNYHVMGRWHYTLADLSWVERKIAGLIYAKPPKASFEEAAEYFKKAISLEPTDVRNHLWLGNTYVELDNIEGAKNEYNAALAITAENDSDRKLQKEAQKLLSDL
ncbi:tetratricopeptide repeat protein [Candidatus Neomarinimicrobiota bacterium]